MSNTVMFWICGGRLQYHILSFCRLTPNIANISLEIFRRQVI